MSSPAFLKIRLRLYRRIEALWEAGYDTGYYPVRLRPYVDDGFLLVEKTSVTLGSVHRTRQQQEQAVAAYNDLDMACVECGINSLDAEGTRCGECRRKDPESAFYKKPPVELAQQAGGVK